MYVAKLCVCVWESIVCEVCVCVCVKLLYVKDKVVCVCVGKYCMLSLCV